MEFDPLSFGALAQGVPGGMAPNPNATPVEREAYRAGWMETFQRPEVRAALLGFGQQLSQPIPIQQSGGGAFTNALASGGAAYDASIKDQQGQAAAIVKSGQVEQGLALEADRNAIAREGQALQAETSAAAQTGQMDRLTKEYELKAKLEAMPPNLAKEAIKGYNDRQSNALFDPTFPKGDAATPEAIEAWKQNLFNEQLDLVTRASAVTPGGAPTPRPVTTTTVPSAEPKGLGGQPPPANLKGRILQVHEAMQLYKDKETGEYFNKNGEKVDVPTQ